MASIQGIYLAFFGRPADPLGLAYWEEQTNDGADLSVMLNALSGTEEYQSRFVGMSDAEVIESIYEALFGREPEAEGLAFFLEALANGTQTLGSIAVNILDGAKGTDLALIGNKIAAAEAFTASLDTPEEIAAYSGEAAADFGRAFINQVTEDPATIPTPEEVQKQINADLPEYEAPGEAPAPGGGGGAGDGDGDDGGDGDGDGDDGAGDGDGNDGGDGDDGDGDGDGDGDDGAGDGDGNDGGDGDDGDGDDGDGDGDDGDGDDGDGDGDDGDGDGDDGDDDGSVTPPTTFTAIKDDDANTIVFGGSATGDITVRLNQVVVDDVTSYTATFTRAGIAAKSSDDGTEIPVDSATNLLSQELVAGENTVIRLNGVDAQLFATAKDALSQVDYEIDILAGAGTYTDTILLSGITEPLKIVGANSELVGYAEGRTVETVFDGRGKNYAIDVPVGSQTPTGDVAFHGVTVIAGARGGVVQGWGSENTGSLTVSNSVIFAGEGFKSAGNAILVSGADSSITGNLIEVATYNQPVANWSTSGVAIFDFANGTVVSENKITTAGELLDGNSVIGVGLDGKYISAGLHDIQISDNFFEGLTFAITIMELVEGTDIVGNEFRDNKTDVSFGSTASGWDDVFGQTRITNNKFSGSDHAIQFVDIDGDSEFIIQHNTFSNPAGAIFFNDVVFAKATIIIDADQFGDQLPQSVVTSKNNALAEEISGFIFEEGVWTVDWENEVGNFNNLTISVTGLSGDADLGAFFGLFK